MASLRQVIALATAVDDEVAATWTSTTLAGSFLVAKLAVRNDASTPAWDSLPSGWVLAEDADGEIASATKASDRAHVEIYVIEDAAARSGAETFGHNGAAQPVALQLEEWAPGAGEVLTLDKVKALATDAGGTTARDTGTTATTSGATLQSGMVAIRNGARTLASIKDSFTERANAVAGSADFSGMTVAAGTKAEASPEAAATGWTVNNASGSQGTGAIVTILVTAGGTTYNDTPSGGIVLGGSVAQDVERDSTVSGGIVLGGTVSSSVEYDDAPSGGIVLGGAAVSEIEDEEEEEAAPPADNKLALWVAILYGWVLTGFSVGLWP